MITQKLYRNGNSVAVTIPKQYLDELKLQEGAEVFVDKKGEELHIVSKNKTLAPDVDPKFMKMVDDFITEHSDVLKELATK